jgi:hypothetical protein
LELRAQIHIQAGEFSKVEADLDEALRMLDRAQVQETLFVKRWQAVMKASKTGSTEPFEELITEAKNLARWEIHREAELFSLKIAFRQDRFENLVYGTPYPAYQRRAAMELGLSAFAPHAVLGDLQGPCFDVESGEIDGKAALKPGSKPHQVLEIVLRDFYRPINVGGLFSELFPGEPFDIFSSPGRVHQNVRRTREWLAKSGLPISLGEADGHYHVESNSGCSFRVPLEKVRVEWYRVHFEKLRKSSSGARHLTASDIKRVLNLSQDEYRRFSKWAVDEGLLVRSYDGSLPIYRFTYKQPAPRAA